MAVGRNGLVEMYYFGGDGYQPDVSHQALGPEVTVRGGFSEKTPMLEAVFDDHVRSLELQFIRAEQRDIEGYPSLIVYQKDKYYQ